MRILVDTNAVLFFALGSPRLSRHVRELIEGQEDELIVSAVIPWEMAIKVATGRLELPGSVERVYRSMVQEIRAAELPITSAHALRVERLPALHRDPFDRLLVAQAMVEGLPIATNDPAIRSYGVDVIW